MVLYATKLKMKKNMTPEVFIRLVIEWNQSHKKHPENIIPNMDWNGERNVRFGNGELWLDIEEYRNGNIIAIRYEKRESDGTVWDTDYIMNFNTMEMVVKLDRGYTEDAMMEDVRFSTPQFIETLINSGFIEADNGFEVVMKETRINQENISLLADIVNGRSHYNLPVVYISKMSRNRDPVNVEDLCYRLKGIAHILLEEDMGLEDPIRSACNNKNAYSGAIGVYFPNGKNSRVIHYGDSDTQKKKVIEMVFQFMNVQKRARLETWEGVNCSIRDDQYTHQRAKRMDAEKDVADYRDTFDPEIEKWKERYYEMMRVNENLRSENRYLREQWNNAKNHQPVLFLGKEDEYYPNEIKEMILDAVAESLKGVKEGSRRSHVYKDILESNHYQKICDEKKQKVKGLFKGYRKMEPKLRQGLKALGIVEDRGKNHHCMVYYDDDRYAVTFSTTGGDSKGGYNMASEIINQML